MWNGREHCLLIVLLSDLPMLTCCQTTCVLYHIFLKKKAKKRYFDTDFADFTVFATKARRH